MIVFSGLFVILSLYFCIKFGIKEMKNKTNYKDRIKAIILAIYVGISFSLMGISFSISGTLFLISFTQIVFVLSLISLQYKKDYFSF